MEPSSWEQGLSGRGTILEAGALLEVVLREVALLVPQALLVRQAGVQELGPALGLGPVLELGPALGLGPVLELGPALGLGPVLELGPALGLPKLHLYWWHLS